MIQSTVELIIPLLLKEVIERDTQDRIVRIKRGLNLDELAKVFKSRNSLISFLLTALKRLRTVGLSLRLYKFENDWYITAVPNMNLPSPLTEEEAFILALVLVLSEKNEITVRSIEDEISNLRIHSVQTRKSIESLIRMGLLERTASNPMKVKIGGIFYVEFSKESEEKIKNLMRFHFLLGKQEVQ